MTRAAVAAALRAQAATILALADAIDAETTGTTDVYADASNNPLGSARAFLDAARAGAFPTFRRNRKVTSKWADVAAWMERRTIPRTSPVKASDKPNVASELAAMGVRLHAVGGRR